MKMYEGWRVGQAVLVTVDAQPLNLRLDLCNHSPSGFEWGYGGSGPAQLALAILADHFEDDDKARDLHQEFKSRVIANLPRTAWSLTSEEIERAIESLNSSSVKERR